MSQTGFLSIAYDNMEGGNSRIYWKNARASEKRKKLLNSYLRLGITTIYIIKNCRFVWFLYDLFINYVSKGFLSIAYDNKEWRALSHLLEECKNVRKTEELGFCSVIALCGILRRSIAPTMIKRPRRRKSSICR